MVWRKSSAMAPFLKRLAELFTLPRELLDAHSACASDGAAASRGRVRAVEAKGRKPVRAGR
jgi:LysR family hydrogen peroxide-inducible transcriptional activator